MGTNTRVTDDAYNRAKETWDIYQQLLSEGVPPHGARRRVAELLKDVYCERTVYNHIALVERVLNRNQKPSEDGEQYNLE